MVRSRLAASAAFVLLLAGCGEGGVDSLVEPSGGEPAFLISDATHTPGRAGFYFRPPMVADASPYPGTFDATLDPVAKVCRLSSSAPYTCTSTIIETFNGGMGPTALNADVAGESYNALWQTPRNLQLGRDRYRLEVYVGTILLGYADFWFVKNSKELKEASDSPDAANYVIVVRGGNIPIKFRIETGVIGTVEVTPSSATQFGAGSQAFTAAVTDLHANPVVGATVAWSSSNTNVATLAPLSGTTDGAGQTSTTASTATQSGEATITASVLGVQGTATWTVVLNRPPVANPDNYLTDEDQILSVPAPGLLSNDTDPDGDPLTAMKVTDPAHGAVTVVLDGSFTYVPDPNYNGPDSFSYKANDGSVDSPPVVVSITVIPVNDAPVAVDDAYSTAEDTPLNVGAPGILANDTDVDGDALTATLVAGPAHGTLILNSNGAFTYTPSPNYNGADSFTYRASDGSLPSNLATVSITVDAGNDAPVAVDDAFNTNEDTPLNGNVLPNDTDLDGDPLTAVKDTDPAHGTVVVNTDGTFTYTPAPDYNGPDSFTYHANDGQADSNTATVSITVIPVNDAPVATDDAETTDEDTPLVVPAPGVLANDTDVDGDALTAVQVSGPTHGSLTLNADGSYTYTPGPDYNGPDAFTYKANDGMADSNVATVNILVNPVADPPTAVADAYDAVANVGITVPAASGVLVNDLNPDGIGTLSVIAAAGATTNGGVFSIAADGSFSYLSAAGFNGSDSFTYTVTNGGAQSVGTVTMTVAGRYWFVDASGAPGGDGRQSSPFQSLAPLNGPGGSGDVDQSGDVILVRSGSYTTGIGLEASQQLVGQGIPADLTIQVNGQTITLLTAGTAPTIGAASGNGISLSTNNTLLGFTAGNAPGAAIAGSAVGALTIASVSINNGTGRALDLSTSGTLAATFGSIAATGGTGDGVSIAGQAGSLVSGSTTLSAMSGAGISLTGNTATIDLGSGSVGTATGTAFSVNGGNANLTYGGSITNAAGRAVSIANRTGGTVTLSGAINETGTGIDLSNNTGATIVFTGAITATTGASVAFSATGGGTVRATNLTSTLTTTTATALNVANTTIGSPGGLAFRSISANGAASGIVLNNTGSSAGLTVGGNGNAGSGGTIQSATGDGISLNNTRDVNLSYMTITGSAEDGIDGTSVTNFTLANSSVTNNGNAANEEGISLANVSGAVILSNVTATGNAYNNLRIDNTAGTISSLSITGGSYSNNQAVTGNHGILIEPRGTSTITTATVSGVTISGNEVMGIQVATADQAVVSDFTVANSTIQNNELGIDFSKAQTSSLTFDITNNALTGHNSHGINLFTAVGAGTTGTFRGTIANNTIGSGGAGSGSAIGNCVRVNINGDANADVLISGNLIRQCPNGRGIEVIGRNGTGGLDVTVTGNDVNPNDTSGFPLAAILVQSNCATVCNTVRADVRNNTVPVGATFDLLPTYIALVETSTSTLQLVDTAPASATCTDQLTSTNTGSASASAGCALIAGPINVP